MALSQLQIMNCNAVDHSSEAFAFTALYLPLVFVRRTVACMKVVNIGLSEEKPFPMLHQRKLHVFARLIGIVHPEHPKQAGRLAACFGIELVPPAKGMLSAQCCTYRFKRVHRAFAIFFIMSICSIKVSHIHGCKGSLPVQSKTESL